MLQLGGLYRNIKIIHITSYERIMTPVLNLDGGRDVWNTLRMDH